MQITHIFNIIATGYVVGTFALPAEILDKRYAITPPCDFDYAKSCCNVPVSYDGTIFGNQCDGSGMCGL
jgi:hypothetical protein